MMRTTEYRGFHIHMELVRTSEDMFDLGFRIEGPMKPAGVAALGKRIKVHGGPFSQRWAHLIGELAGRAAVDVILGVEDVPPATDEW
ncbi:hypothetical protein [Ralstonia solanacearum]|uniref:Uncharacterized protein n=1 Tax=Ralstonia solanacearum TaxID=305 RepID=A0AAD0S4R4_RALSL|nr:hypothetical protein [Ralstonia solanacearum]AXV80251.1 hypothetical protein CJO77_01090 [Ralstonia solanacearum]AXW51396.1 hypothetical protein CJO92_01090 [Ralstonia solanacearum]CBM09966.1 hypothethical protein [Ralstonia solanacearum PSI07]